MAAFLQASHPIAGSGYAPRLVMGRAEMGKLPGNRTPRLEDFSLCRLTASDRGLRAGSECRRIAARPLSLCGGQSPPRTSETQSHSRECCELSGQPMVVRIGRGTDV